MLPLVCNDAVAILFMFDLSRKSTLNSVKEWYRQARGFNKVSMQTSYLIGDDTFASLELVLMGRDVALYIAITGFPPPPLSFVTPKP